jgi:hypothetical protein
MNAIQLPVSSCSLGWSFFIGQGLRWWLLLRTGQVRSEYQTPLGASICIAPPTNPGFDLKTGDADPSAGVGNCITVNCSAGAMVKRSASRQRRDPGSPPEWLQRRRRPQAARELGMAQRRVSPAPMWLGAHSLRQLQFRYKGITQVVFIRFHGDVLDSRQACQPRGKSVSSTTLESNCTMFRKLTTLASPSFGGPLS